MYDSTFKKFVRDAREKAFEVSQMPHTGAEAKEVIKNLVQIVEQIEGLISTMLDSNVDSRVAQRRLDALKAEHREVQKQLESVREMVASQFGPILKSIAQEAAQIANTDCASRLKGSVKQMVEILSKL